MNKKTADLRDAERFIQQANSLRAELKLPSGTLAEVSGEIRKLEKEYQVAQETLKRAEIEEARQEGEKKAKQAAALSPSTLPPADSNGAQSETAGPPPVSQPTGPAVSFPPNGNAAESILAIMEAIKSVGCPVCANGAAMMVAKRELRRYQEQGVI